MAVRLVLRGELRSLLVWAELFVEIALLGLGHKLVLRVHELALQVGIMLS
jgi:hypothetical protein